MTATRRVLAALLGLALCGPGAPPAWASTDVDLCSTVWSVDPFAYHPCGGIAALVPANDTRANLLLLLFDRHGMPPGPSAPVTAPVLGWRDFRGHFASRPRPKEGDALDAAPDADAGGYAAGEGSRCRGAGAGAAAFAGAVAAAAGLSADERASLVAARAALKPGCAGGAAAPAPLPGVTSAPGRAFARYLDGAAAFYAGRFADAEAAFAAPKDFADPWLADTADYMVARTRVNAAQVGAFDEYGYRKGEAPVAAADADRAQAALDAYLERHPDGRYAASARGLLRRVDWLAGRTEALAARYAALVAEPPAKRGLDDIALAEEIDDKLLPKLAPGMTRDPVLLAVLDLRAMRVPTDPRAPKPDRPDLDAQRGAFAAAPDLHAYLRAVAALALDGAPVPVIAGLPDDTRRRGGDYLWFSRQFLRGQALDAAHDPNAGGFWRELRPGADRPLDGTLVELASALHEERRGRPDEVFAPGSVVADPAIRTVLLEHAAGPALLRAQARNAANPDRVRAVALFTLLFKEATRGRAAEFLDDLAAVPADAPAAGGVAPNPEEDGPVPLGIFARGPSAGEIGCPPLPDTAARLAGDPASIRGRLCMAEFVRLNGFDGADLDDRPSPDVLGGGPSRFPGEAYTRSAAYLSIIDDRRAPAEDRAYALYRAVKCYEPAGHSACGPDAPRSARRGWFAALKRDYPGSRWAKRLTLWW